MLIDFIMKSIFTYFNYFGPLAQWLEQATHNRLVAGSNPARATNFKNGFIVYYLLN